MSIQSFISDLKQSHPSIKIYTDLLMRLGKGTDAGFYRQIPQVIVRADKEIEIVTIIGLCRKYRLPYTFKAGGTSLSGQTISDSVLIELGTGFNTSRISVDGKTATFGPAVVGEQANMRLARFGRKLGPSPASIAAAKIGGIVANNASGSSYGILHNSYHTIRSMRIVLPDGSILDTSNASTREAFKKQHPEFCGNLLRLRETIFETPAVRKKIQYKFELKNTCGYGVNSLIDFEDPVDIIQHLMVGSEGTLGFISEVTFETVPDYRFKASALIFFPHIRLACQAITPLRECSVSAAELMDRNALKVVQDLEGMPEILKSLTEETVALLIDTSADDEGKLQQQILEITEKLSDIKTVFPIEFTTDPAIYNTYWKVRKGLFTSAAASRPKGTACIIEDLAFRADVLGDALVALQELFLQYGYDWAIIWGHLLDGNIHFVVMPNFNSREGIEEYHRFMLDVVNLTLNRFNGSLKAEHGTGRNMAPFVEQEWGSDIYRIMQEIKQIFDPENLLNPGVVLNDDPDILIKNLKPLPEANELIDKCIECGFCEPQCPSRNLTMTPRQRIVLYRQLVRLQVEGQTGSGDYKILSKQYQYNGDETCATDGLCERACPVGINTEKLVKELRWQHNGKTANTIASMLANHISGLTSILRFWLKVPHTISQITGYGFMESCTRMLFRISGRKFPLWTRHTPSGSPKMPYRSDTPATGSLEVVYFPSCINRTMGISSGYEEKTALVQKTEKILRKARVRIIYPENIHRLCCGMAFDSKGFKKQGMDKARELEAALLLASDNGRIPILCDMSPCLYRMKETLDKRLKLYEPVEYILEYLKDKLMFRQLPVSVAIHSTCSNTKMGLENKLYALASLCAEKVLAPEEIGCCAWAGDRGFFYPELNSSALQGLKSKVEGIQYGYSTSRTCEIGLSMHSGITYQSIVYLVDRATE